MKLILSLAFCAMMSACSTQPRLKIPEIRASCPDLRTPTRTDPDAQTRRIQELEWWYSACRGSVLKSLDE
jgi:hypothetical protein